MAMQIKTSRDAKNVLIKILDDRKEIAEKNCMQENALIWGARALTKAVEDGANFHHEAAILSYHANNKMAILFCDEGTRNAIKAAVFVLDRAARKEEGKGTNE